MSAALLPGQATAAGVRHPRLPRLDYWLLGGALTLLALGLVMVTSASLPVGERDAAAPFHYVVRHLGAIGLGLTLAGAAFAAPVGGWERAGGWLFFVGLVLLALLLVPGIGRTVNGATRWIPTGLFTLQPSELMKLFTVVYIAGYLVRRQVEVSTRFSGFAKPLVLLVLASSLTMLQPDFGATAVMMGVALGMLFLGGVPLPQFAALIGVAGAAAAGLVLASPYRLARITAYIDPWADPFGSGYQLSQALIAFGRGEWFGVGLGNGIQKQYYLPEAHTDFLMAVVGEELGFIGTLVVILLFALLTWRAFQIGNAAERLGRCFAAYCAYGLGLWLGLQAFVNIGVNVGLLPTKGLTLPLMSYGGNSIILSCVVVALLLRIDHEARIAPAESAPGRDR